MDDQIPGPCRFKRHWTTSVDGNGANPGEKEIMSVGMKASMKKKDGNLIMEQIRQCISKDLKEFI